MRYLGSFFGGFPVYIGALRFVGFEDKGFRVSGA